MGSFEKLLSKAKASQHNYDFDDLCKLAELSGFEWVRTNGSHKLYRHSSTPKLMNFQDHHGKAKPFQVKQLLNIIEEIDKRGKKV